MAERNSPKTSILYYPTIDVPTDDWLRQALLYWDEVGSIVPEQWEADHKYRDDIRYLKDEGEFRPFRPKDFIQAVSFEDARKRFEKEFQLLWLSELRREPQDPETSLIHPEMWAIHREKLSHSMVSFFAEANIIKQSKGHQSKGHYDWYRLPRKTALLYMGLLAKYVADVDSEFAIPSTGDRNYERLIYDVGPPGQGIACIDVRFRSALPIPRSDVPLRAIVDFKRRHRAELLSFRQEVGAFQKRLAEAKHMSEAKELVAGFADLIRKDLSNLTAALEDSRVETVVGSFKTIVNVKSPTFWGSLGGMILGGALTAHPVAWALGGLAVGGTIDLAHHLIGSMNRQRAELRASSVALLYHAREEGLILSR
jgi:Family of unknown function (DUF6236)